MFRNLIGGVLILGALGCGGSNSAHPVAGTVSWSGGDLAGHLVVVHGVNTAPIDWAKPLDLAQLLALGGGHGGDGAGGCCALIVSRGFICFPSSLTGSGWQVVRAWPTRAACADLVRPTSKRCRRVPPRPPFRYRAEGS